MIRFLFVVCAFLFLSLEAQSANFDCEATLHPVERVICGDEELLKLDEELAEIFHSHQSSIIDGDTSWTNEEHNFWLEEVRETCSALTEIAVCVKEVYENQIDLLAYIPFIKRGGERTEDFRYIAEFIPGYEIGLNLRKPVICNEKDACKITGSLTIYRSRHKNAHQMIKIPGLDFFIDPAADDACNLFNMEIWQVSAMGCTFRLNGVEMTQEFFKDMVRIDDYNFDGFPDFAFGLKNSYAYVFLYSKRDDLFYYAPALSRIFETPRVVVDKKRQEITNFYTYPFYRSEEAYQVKQNMPVLQRSLRSYREGDDLVTREYIWQDDGEHLVKKERIRYWGDEKQDVILDCAKAAKSLDHMICDDEELSSLNERLTEAVRNFQETIIKGDTSFVNEQRNWWERMHWNYIHDSKFAFIIKGELQRHIESLNVFPYIQSSDGEDTVLIRNTDLLPNYDIALTLISPTGCEAGTTCALKGQVALYKKGEGRAHQVIGVPWLDLFISPVSADQSCPLDHLDIVPSSSSGCSIWFEGRVIAKEFLTNLFHVADYNFDGFPDFVLSRFIPFEDSDAFEAGFLFLYDEQDERFYYAPSFSRLFNGMHVQVDKTKQELKSFFAYPTHSEAVYYNVNQNMLMPLRRFKRSVYDDIKEVYESEETWQNGEWQVVKEELTTLEE